MSLAGAGGRALKDGSRQALQQRWTPEHLTPLPQPSVSSFVTWEGAAHLPGFFPGLPPAGLCRPAHVGIRSPSRASRSRWQPSMASRGHCRAAQTVLRQWNGPLQKATCSQGCMGTASSVHPPFRGVVQTPGPSGLTSLQVEGGRHPVSPPNRPSAPQHYALFGSPWGGSRVVTNQSAPRGTTAALPGFWVGPHVASVAPPDLWQLPPVGDTTPKGQS